MNKIPECSKNAYVAEMLVSAGFHFVSDEHYDGHDDYDGGFFLDTIGDWHIYSCIGEPAIAVLCDGVVLALYLDGSFEDLLIRVRTTIIRSLHRWENDSNNHLQLSIF